MMKKTFYYSIPTILIGITLIIIFLIQTSTDQEPLITNPYSGFLHSHGDGHEHSHEDGNVIFIDQKSGLRILSDNTDAGGYKTASITIDEEIYFIDIADTPQLKQRGLSNRTQLRDGGGMIFIFDQPAQHGIWMKDMNFPIDILWVNADQTVVHYESNISPDTYPQVFIPPVGADYVIEIAANTWTASSTISW